jgi:hypothetical protein
MEEQNNLLRQYFGLNTITGNDNSKVNEEDRNTADIENDKEIYESDLFKLDYKILLDRLLMKYPVSIRMDIEDIEKKHGVETAKKEIIKKLLL